jgi:5,5'-dehydrodivanillate O-demethylase oxygenase subunit
MDGVRDIGWAELPCNWLQIMENAVDPHHVEWLHGRYFDFLARQQGFQAPSSFGKRHVKVAFDAFEFGIIKRRVLEGHSEEDDDWKVGHPMVFPYNMRVGGAGMEQMQIRVPVDDTTTRFMLYTVHAPEGATFPEQATIPDYELPWLDSHGRHIVDYVEGQDIMAWVTQGPIADRTVEHLGKSDIGVTMLRRMFKEQLARVEAGEDPLGVVRVPHERIDLPCEKDKFGAGAEFALQWIDRGSGRYSPLAEQLRRLHLDAAAARERAAVGA